MNDWLVGNALPVYERRQFIGDLRIRGGRSERIDLQMTAEANETVFYAAGRWMLPGMIDDQAHFRESGLEQMACHSGEHDDSARGQSLGSAW
jgi:dihydroorotase